MGGREDRQAARQRFEQNLPEALGDRWKHEHIRRLILGDEFLRAHIGADIDLRTARGAEGFEEFERVDHAPTDGEVNLRSTEETKSLEEVFDALALIDTTDKQQAKRTPRRRAALWRGDKAVRIHPVGDHLDRVS